MYYGSWQFFRAGQLGKAALLKAQNKGGDAYIAHLGFGRFTELDLLSANRLITVAKLKGSFALAVVFTPFALVGFQKFRSLFGVS